MTKFFDFLLKVCFFPFLYLVSEEMDRVLALIEELPATPLTTQVICVCFLDPGRAAKAHDGWPVRRDTRQNHVIYNGEQTEMPHTEPLET